MKRPRTLTNCNFKFVLQFQVQVGQCKYSQSPGLRWDPTCNELETDRQSAEPMSQMPLRMSTMVTSSANTHLTTGDSADSAVHEGGLQAEI